MIPISSDEVTKLSSASPNNRLSSTAARGRPRPAAPSKVQMFPLRAGEMVNESGEGLGGPVSSELNTERVLVGVIGSIGSAFCELVS